MINNEEITFEFVMKVVIPFAVFISYMLMAYTASIVKKNNTKTIFIFGFFFLSFILFCYLFYSYYPEIFS